MKAIFCIFLSVLMAFDSAMAISKPLEVDAYQACMNRTKHDRVNCQANCGLIVQQCYGEGVEDENKKIDALVSAVKSRSGANCFAFATDYLSKASRMEKDVGDKSQDLIGWTASALALNFAKQRVENLKVMVDTCKQ
jgi:hypothetical protein